MAHKKRNAGKTKSPKLSTTREELSHNPFANIAEVKFSAKAPARTSECLEVTPAVAPAPTPPQTTQLPRFPRRLHLRREITGRSGKTITRVSGVPRSEIETIASQLKKALGCGAKIEGDDILVLGSLVQRTADWLRRAGANNIVIGN